MGFRFRKTINIIPGIRLNVSKSGVSTSVGKPGATLNFSSRGTRSTVGLPGTGLSYTASSKPSRGRTHVFLWLVLAVVTAAFIWMR